MIRAGNSASGRHGLSLLEVLIALAIFLFSLIGLGQLLTFAGQRARDVQEQGRAAQLAQAKLAEVVAGVVPLSSQGDAPCDEDPEWQWSLDAQPHSVSGLWQVQVRVSRQRRDGTRIESSISELVLDPSLRGNATDAAINAANTAASSGSSGTTGSSSSAPAASGN